MAGRRPQVGTAAAVELPRLGLCQGHLVVPTSSPSWPRPEEAMLTVSEQVSQEMHQSLKSMGLAALSSDNTASLIGQLRSIAKEENCVRSVIGEVARGVRAAGRGRAQPWKSVPEPVNRDRHDH